MKKILFSLLIVASFSASAECWIVKDVKGTTYSGLDNFKQSHDFYSGKFMIAINGDSASVTYDGLNMGGVNYKAFSQNSIIGLNVDGNKFVVESWSILPDGKVIMSKTTSGFGKLDSSKAMTGIVENKC